MQVFQWKISDVIPYKDNPRKNNEAVAPVARSIKEFGFRQPIIVDATGVIIAGHTRWKAAKKLKLKTVPVIIADNLTSEQVKAYRLADNKTGELALWDDTLLQTELAALVNDFDMAEFGFELLVQEDEKQAKEKLIPELYQVVVECADEADQQDVYNELTAKGLKCRLLFL